MLKSIVECYVSLYNLPRIRNITFHKVEVDCKDLNYNVIPGTWRQEINLHHVDPPPHTARNRAKQAAKDQLLYLQRYFNEHRREEVPRQDQMITLNRH